MFEAIYWPAKRLNEAGEGSELLVQPLAGRSLIEPAGDVLKDPTGDWSRESGALTALPCLHPGNQPRKLAQRGMRTGEVAGPGRYHR